MDSSHSHEHCSHRGHRNKKAAKALLRMATGVIFMMHGFEHWEAIAHTAMFFGHLGVPGMVAYLVTFAEILGGLALVLGIFTRAVAAIFAVIMVGAIVLTHREFNITSYELELMLFAASLFIAVAGPGAWALARFCTCRCHKDGKKGCMCDVVNGCNDAMECDCHHDHDHGHSHEHAPHHQHEEVPVRD